MLLLLSDVTVRTWENDSSEERKLTDVLQIGRVDRD